MANISEKPAVFVLDPYHESAILKLQQNSNINLTLPSDFKKVEWLTEATAVMVRSETRLTSDLLQKAGPELKYIIKQGVGVDNIDLEAALQRGIKVFNTPGLNSESVAELTISLCFCIARRVCEFDRRIRSGEKVFRSQMFGKSLFQKTIGVVGMGNIGIQVAKKWIGVTGGNVVAFDPYAPSDSWRVAMPEGSWERATTLQALLEVSDVVSLHVPLTRSTQNLLSKDQFAVMKDGAILLNCARGGVIDENALLEALNSEHLFGAGLDAVLYEPPTLDQYGDSLLSHPRCLITPHIGASTEENQEKSGLAAVQILLDLLAGPSGAGVPDALN